MREYHDTTQDGECEREDIVQVCVCVHMTYIFMKLHMGIEAGAASCK